MARGMSEAPPQVRRVSRARLEAVMREALRSPTARLREWTWQPLPYHAVLPDRTLVRVTGWALLDDERSTRWSSVLKLFAPAAGAAGAGGRRELLAYRSSLLADLPGPLRAPRVLGLDEEGDGSGWLWLEDVGDVYGRRWPLAQFGRAARHLGAFNGAYPVARALPTEPWLNDWLARRRTGANPGPEDVAALARLGQPAATHRLFGAPVGPRAAQVLRDQARFVRLLTELPQTLCHHESSLANLFAVRGPDGQLETVAVDWEQVGPGPIGADIATLVFGTLRRCEFDAARAAELDRVVFDGYIGGLRDAGWAGPIDHARLGFAAAVALRWGFLASALRELLAGAPHVQHPSHGGSVSTAAAVRQWVRLIEFVLDRAQEARRLSSRLTL
jgi:hypothetical protein